MRITQAYVSTGLKFFEKAFREKYGLKEYSNPSEPCIFFGMYGMKDWAKLSSHTGLCIVVWGGSDIAHILQLNDLYLQTRFLRGNVHHIAIGKYIEEDLSVWKIPYFSVPVCPFDHKLNIRSKGPGVYTYLPESNMSKYGLFYINEIMEKDKSFSPFIGNGLLSRDHVSRLYDSCYIGLRLTAHDGLPNTVIELGLRGIPCVYNGGLPGSLAWETSDDIISHIENHKQYIGKCWPELALEMEAFINRDREKWLNTEYYE